MTKIITNHIVVCDKQVTGVRIEQIGQLSPVSSQFLIGPNYWISM